MPGSHVAVNSGKVLGTSKSYIKKSVFLRKLFLQISCELLMFLPGAGMIPGGNKDAPAPLA